MQAACSAGPAIAETRIDRDFLSVARQTRPPRGDDPTKNKNQPSGKPGANGVGGSALGVRIYTRMKLLGLTKADLMRRVGVKRWATIHDWIEGRQVPRAMNLFRLAEALEMDPIVLLDELLPEPSGEGWKTFKATHVATLSVDDLIDMRVIARRRPWLTASALEATLYSMRVGAPTTH